MVKMVKCWRCRVCCGYYTYGLWQTCEECNGEGEITEKQADGRTVWDSRRTSERETEKAGLG